MSPCPCGCADTARYAQPGDLETAITRARAHYRAPSEVIDMAEVYAENRRAGLSAVMDAVDLARAALGLPRVARAKPAWRPTPPHTTWRADQGSRRSA